MGRQSSTGLPFLIARTDTQKYVYYRSVAPSLREHIACHVMLPWATKATSLNKPPTIKISLKTGDKDTARLRWHHVHTKIEALMQLARDRLAARTRKVLAQPVASLAPASIKHMADQVRHDLLNADDDIAIDPTFTTPINDVILQILESDGQYVEAVSTRRSAQDVERRLAKAWAKRADIGSFDTKIEEGEIEVDEAILEELNAVRAKLNLADPKLNHGAREVSGEKIDDTTVVAGQIDGASSEDARAVGIPESRNRPKVNEYARCALDKALENVNVIASPVDKVLAANDITLDRHHPDRRRLALTLLRATTSAYDDIAARREGAPIETPLRPDPIKPVVKSKTISQMRDLWIDEIKPGKKAMDDNALYVRYFIGVCGDKPMRDITSADIRGYRDLLRRRPRNMPRAIAKLSLQEQVVWGEEHGGNVIRFLSPQTINAKGLGSISTLMELAIKEEELETNLCHRLRLKAKKRALERRPYSIDDLNKIFASPIYVNGKRPKGGGEAAFWLPLIGLFAGARLEEIGQLLIADLKREEDIDFFNFIEIDEEAEDTDTKSKTKTIKTNAGRRRVPIHPILKRLGLMNYADEMRRQGHVRLFPDLPDYRGRRTKEFSKFWGRYADKHITKSRRKVFHSFRHAFEDRLRNIFDDQNIAKPLMGHVSHMYGQPIGLKKRNRIICALDYPGLDLSQIRTSFRP